MSLCMHEFSMNVWHEFSMNIWHEFSMNIWHEFSMNMWYPCAWHEFSINVWHEFSMNMWYTIFMHIHKYGFIDLAWNQHGKGMFLAWIPIIIKTLSNLLSIYISRYIHAIFMLCSCRIHAIFVLDIWSSMLWVVEINAAWIWHEHGMKMAWNISCQM